MNSFNKRTPEHEYEELYRGFPRLLKPNYDIFANTKLCSYKPGWRKNKDLSVIDKFCAHAIKLGFIIDGSDKQRYALWTAYKRLQLQNQWKRSQSKLKKSRLICMESSLKKESNKIRKYIIEAFEDIKYVSNTALVCDKLDRKYDGNLYILVKWQGYKKRSWEPVSSLSKDVSPLVDKYLKNYIEHRGLV
jgi:hypothetical protein